MRNTARIFLALVITSLAQVGSAQPEPRSSRAYANLQLGKDYMTKVPLVSATTAGRLALLAKGHFAICRQELEILFASDSGYRANLAPEDSDLATLGEMLDVCTSEEQRAAAIKLPQQPAAAAPPPPVTPPPVNPTPPPTITPAAILSKPTPPPVDRPAVNHQAQIEQAEQNFQQAIGRMRKAKKIASANSKYATLRTSNEYSAAIALFQSSAQLLTTALGAEPSLGEQQLSNGSKTMTAKEMAEKAELRAAKTKGKKQKLGAKLKKDLADFSKEASKSLRGDRKKIFRRRGVPTSYTGSDTWPAPRKMIQLLGQSDSWTYAGTHCTTVHQFRGNELVEKTSTPKDCQE